MDQLQPFNKKIKYVKDLEGYREYVQKSIFVKDLPINDFRFNLGYPTELNEPVMCKGTPENGLSSKADVPDKVIFKVLMSYSEAFHLSYTSHPLQNIILKPGNYLEGPKPGISEKMHNYSLPLDDYSIYDIYIPEVKTLNDINTVKIINWLWVNQRHNYDAWMKIISAMVLARCRTPEGEVEHDLIKKCVSTRMIVNALIGHRGLCHGSRDLKVPKLEINQSSGLYSSLPGWALHFDTDDNSSFHLSSPDNSDFDTDSADSGPIGVACNRPRITGFTSFTETSSESSDETSGEIPDKTSDETLKKAKTSRLDVYIDGHSGDYWDRRMRKRFDLYIRTSLNERRNRGAIRNARRKVRLQYNKQRRLMEPAFNAEAKRAEALAAERVRAEIRNREAKQRVNNNPRPREKTIEHYLHQYKEFNHKLRSQLECSWTRYYGKNFIPSYFDNLERQNDVSLKCFVSPVPYIEQKEINNGFASVYMALFQMRLIEVIAGEESYFHRSKSRELLKMFPNGAEYLHRESCRIITAGVRTLYECYHVEVQKLITELRHRRMTNWGEIFSGLHLQYVANYTNEPKSRYNIRLVKRDFLANYKNDLSPDSLEVEKCASYNSMSIVQRLVRGHLIAVCYDADENKRPTNNGGRTAHWTLLCGVIIGFPSKQPTKHPPKKPLPVVKSERPHKDKELAYVYHYEPEDHLLTPKGYISRETGEPVNMETIKERAALVDEAPKYNCDKHSQSCKEGRQKCQKCTIEYVDKKLDLERDGDRVWVVARHRNEYVVWTLRELANSNRQLRTPGKEILDTVPRHVKDDWLLHDQINGLPLLSASLKSTSITLGQRNRERLNVLKRKNRVLCSMLVDQMDSLRREYPYSLPCELVHLLDMSVVSDDWADEWKAAVVVAYETRFKFPRTEPMPPEMPMTEKPTHQTPVAPPPLPIPTSPTPVTPPMNITESPNTNRPYLIHGGPNLNFTLTGQYVCFEPLEPRYKNNGMDTVPDVNDLNDTMLMPIDFYFSFDGKLASKIRRGQRSRMAASKNHASTSSMFTG